MIPAWSSANWWESRPEIFEAKVATLAIQNLVQQGGELSYLLLHDPEYRARVRKEHLVQAGKGVRLKKNIRQLSELLAQRHPGLSLRLPRHFRRPAGSY